MTIEEAYLDNIRLIKNVTKRFGNKFAPDDAYSIQLDAIELSLKEYNAGRAKFSTFLFANLKHAYLNAGRKSKSDLEFLPLDFDIAIEPKNEEMEELIECLSAFQRQIVRDKYVYNYTLEEIGNKNNLTKVRIFQLLQCSIEQIRKENFD